MTAPYVVGVDLSLTSTGLAAGEATLAIAPTRIGEEFERLVCIRDIVIDSIQNLQPIEGSPFIVLEGYSYGQRVGQPYSLGELGGVVKEAFFVRGWRWVSVPPKVRAKFATGNGNANKGEVISAVSARTGIVWSGRGADDECDAWILQEMGLAHFGAARHKWPQVSIKVLDSVDWSPFYE